MLKVFRKVKKGYDSVVKFHKNRMIIKNKHTAPSTIFNLTTCVLCVQKAIFLWEQEQCLVNSECKTKLCRRRWWAGDIRVSNRKKNWTDRKRMGESHIVIRESEGDIFWIFFKVFVLLWNRRVEWPLSSQE